MRKIVLLIFFVIILPNCLYGQDFSLVEDVHTHNMDGGNMIHYNLPQVFTPESSGHGRNSKIPVSLFNGTAHISVPVAQLEAKGHTLPVYLTYNTEGNKVDTHPGWAGLGWTLHAGGSINRIIHGLKDEQTYAEAHYIDPILSDGHAFSTEQYLDPGYLFHPGKYADISQSDSSRLHELCEYRSPIDFQPDEFQVSVGDISGSFYFGNDGEVKILSNGPSFSVQYETENAGSNQVPFYYKNASCFLNVRHFNYFSAFTITSVDGVKYCFGGDLGSIEFSYVQTYGGVGPRFVGTANTWHLKKIVYPNGEEIIFEYEKQGFPIVMSDIHSREVAFVDVYSYLSDGTPYSEEDTPRRIVPLMVRKTVERDVRDVEVYSNLSYTVLHPSYLKSIVSKERKDTLSFLRSESFGLNCQIDEYKLRLHLGQYTGGDGVYFNVPQFIQENKYYHLDEVKGVGRRVLFEYNDDDLVPAVQRRRLHLVSLIQMNDTDNDACYSFQYNSLPLPAFCSKNVDHWGYSNGHAASNVFTYIRDLSFAEDFVMTSSSYNVNTQMNLCRIPDERYMQAEILTSIRYPTGGLVMFEYEANHYQSVFNHGPTVLDLESGMAGGLRVKTIREVSDSVERRRTFAYNDSGTLSGKPVYGELGYYTDTLSERQFFFTVHIDSTHVFMRGSEKYLNHLSGGPSVTYESVTETLPDSSKIVYRFTNYLESPDALPFVSFRMCAGEWLYPVLTSHEHGRGLLSMKLFLDTNGELVRREEYQYAYNTAETGSITSIQQLMTNPVRGSLMALGTKIILASPLLARKTVTTYPDGDGEPVVETTDYEWDDHRQLKRTVRSVAVPENESIPVDTLVEERFYARDYLQSGTDGVDYPGMTAAGMGGIPVEKVVSRNGELVSADLTEWKYYESSGCYLPYRRSTSSPSGYAYMGGGLYNGRYSSAPYSLPEYAVMSYDAKSDPSEIYLKDGRYGVYTWDGRCNMRGQFIGARQDRLVQLDHYLPENVYKEIDLTHNVESFFEYDFSTCSDSLCRVVFSFMDGNDLDVWGRLDSLSFNHYATSLSPGELPLPISEQHLLPSGAHYVLLATHPLSTITYNQAPGYDNPVGPETPEGPDHPGWTEPDPDYPSPMLRGTLRLYYRDLVNHPYYEQWSQVRHFSFEGADSDSAGGFESAGARVSPFSFSAIFDPGTFYVIDMMVKRNGSWEYERQPFTLSADGQYTLYEGGDPFDEVRIYPVGAEVETYTWWTDGTLRSRTDGRGVTESYVYDALGRLVEVRDNDGHAVEGYDYHYATHQQMMGL